MKSNIRIIEIISKFGRIVNDIVLRPFGLRLIRVPLKHHKTIKENPLGTVVQCLVPDEGFVEHIKLHSKTVTMERARDLETFFFGGENYSGYEKALKPLEDFFKLVLLPENFTFLDVGCAVGQLVPFLQRKGIQCKYIGIDVAYELVALATSRFQQHGYNFLRADGTSMPFSDLSFDVVYSRSTLISTYDWKKALKEHLRVAKRWVILLHTPFHTDSKETIFFIQHSRIHTSLLCSFTQEAFLDCLPKNIEVEIKPCGCGFEVINFGEIKWYDVFIKL